MRPDNETCIRVVKVIFALRPEKRDLLLASLERTGPDWQAAINKKRIVAQSVMADPGVVSNTLGKAGFKPDEYHLEVEFCRKWGVL